MSAEVIIIPIVFSYAVAGISKAIFEVSRQVLTQSVNIENRSREVEEKRQRLEKEIERLHSEELLEKAKTFKSIEEFNKWYLKEVLSYKKIEAEYLHSIEKIRFALEEEKRTLEARYKNLVTALSKLKIDIEQKTFDNVENIKNEIKKIEAIALEKLSELELKMKEMITCLSGNHGVKAKEIFAKYLKTNNNRLIEERLLIAVESFENVKRIFDFDQKLRACIGEIDMDEYIIDLNKLVENVSKKQKAIEIEQIKSKIEILLGLIKNLCPSEYERIKEKFKDYDNIQDLYAIENLFNELKIIYGTLKTEISISNVYRKLIEETKNKYVRYENIQKLSEKILSKEKITDSEYKQFIEEMTLCLSEEIYKKEVSKRKKYTAEKLEEMLKARGYELIIDNEDGENEKVSLSLEKGEVVDIIPSYSRDYLVKMKMKENGELVFKFFKTCDSGEEISQQDYHFATQWCNDLKEIRNVVNKEIPMEFQLIVEPEKVTNFPRAKVKKRDSKKISIKQRTNTLYQKSGE